MNESRFINSVEIEKNFVGNPLKKLLLIYSVIKKEIKL